MFFERSESLPRRTIFMPVLATLLYGFIALFLNAIKVIDGPYFFLRVYEVPAGTIAMWFGIITVLCIALAGIYLWGHRRASYIMWMLSYIVSIKQALHFSRSEAPVMWLGLCHTIYHFLRTRKVKKSGSYVTFLSLWKLTSLKPKHLGGALPERRPDGDDIRFKKGGAPPRWGWKQVWYIDERFPSATNHEKKAMYR